jgi:hypothetical protein
MESRTVPLDTYYFVALPDGLLTIFAEEVCHLAGLMGVVGVSPFGARCDWRYSHSSHHEPLGLLLPNRLMSLEMALKNGVTETSGRLGVTHD